MLTATRRILSMSGGAALALGAWVPLAGAVQARAPGRASAASSGWQVEQYFGTFCDGFSSVSSVTATGPDNAWAVGDFCPSLDNGAPLFAHWDGGSWQELRPPDDQRLSYGSAVASLSSSYSWLFAPGGSQIDSQNFALLRRASKWKTFQLANDSVITSAVVFSRSNAWGFGTIGQGAYAVRFDGRSWRRVPIPVVPEAMAAPKPDDIWVVGPPVSEAGVPTPHSYELARWTGTRWQVRPFPTLSVPAGAYLGGAWAVSAGSGGVDVAVQFKTPYFDGGVLLNWNGTQWHNIALPANLPLSELGPMAHDGHGGLWLGSITSDDPNFYPVMLHLSAAGQWSHTTVAVYGLSVLTMRLIPGTASLWAGGLDCGDDGACTPAMVRYDP